MIEDPFSERKDERIGSIPNPYAYSMYTDTSTGSVTVAYSVSFDSSNTTTAVWVDGQQYMMAWAGDVPKRLVEDPFDE